MFIITGNHPEYFTYNTIYKYINYLKKILSHVLFFIDRFNHTHSYYTLYYIWQSKHIPSFDIQQI